MNTALAAVAELVDARDLKSLGLYIPWEFDSPLRHWRLSIYDFRLSILHFILGIVEEETDETAFWLELIIESNILKENLVNDLLKESNEILKIIIKSKITAKNNIK